LTRIRLIWNDHLAAELTADTAPKPADLRGAAGP